MVLICVITGSAMAAPQSEIAAIRKIHERRLTHFNNNIEDLSEIHENDERHVCDYRFYHKSMLRELSLIYKVLSEYRNELLTIPNENLSSDEAQEKSTLVTFITSEKKEILPLIKLHKNNFFLYEKKCQEYLKEDIDEEDE